MKYWIVVWNKVTGDFKNALIKSNINESSDDIEARFEGEYKEYRVIHIGEGELPPKTYRSLEYIN